MPPPNRRVRQSRARRKPNNDAKTNKHEEQKKVEETEKQKQEKSAEKFNAHRKEAKESIQKLLEELSDSSDDDTPENQDRLAQIQQSMRGDYSGDDLAFEKATQNLQSTCVICLEKVRTKDATWQCDQCFCLLHLPCTQGWARSCFCEETGGNEDENGHWACPKCRMLYPRQEIPRSYLCFCGKLENPPIDHWIIPHSCGAACHKPLKPDCGHECTLRCHPGACPPCPQTIEASCFCGSEKTTRRCNDREYSCTKRCNKVLACGEHKCEQACHAGTCPPCTKMRIARCQCGAQEAKIQCSDGLFRCDKVCNKPLSCGNHNCPIQCHTGECGICPMEGPRPCHCGKVIFDELSCEDATPSCEDTCGKPLDCYGNHRCNQRCHPGDCSKCRMHIVKSCRCGANRKSVQCWQEFLCEKKCARLRDCKRHQCRKKCCTGDCPPCNETCGRKLACGNHLCQAICHSNACFPCPVTVDVTCFCKTAITSVPCGAERKTKPPRCRKDCMIPPTCHHPGRERHTCHFGQCPPCEQICCVVPADCSHPCPEPCHDPIPPWPTKPKQLRNFDPMRLKSLPVEEVQCKPCNYVVKRQCFGLHDQYDVICHTERLFDCKRACGNPLECGNHKCEIPCHIVTNPRDQRQILPDATDHPTKEAFQDTKYKIPVMRGKQETLQGSPELSEILLHFQNKYKDTCLPCSLRCEKTRKPPCKHPCPLPCHPGDCPRCEVLVRKYCHCPLSTLKVMKCHETNISKEEMDAIRSCGVECTKKLSCGHTCNMICHAGDCRPVSECMSRVRKHCPCKNLKFSFICSEQHPAIECDDSCATKKKEQEQKHREAQEKKKKQEEKQRELDLLRNGPEKRKRKPRKKPEQIIKKPEPYAITIRIKSLYNTLTSETFWKTVFVYSLPFIFLFVFVIIALLK